VPTGITSGPDGAIWFTEGGLNVLNLLNPTVGKIGRLH
jgi:streptogramin lyase